jgi:hypothetical protein
MPPKPRRTGSGAGTGAGKSAKGKTKPAQPDPSESSEVSTLSPAQSGMELDDDGPSFEAMVNDQFDVTMEDMQGQEEDMQGQEEDTLDDGATGEVGDEDEEEEDDGAEGGEGDEEEDEEDNEEEVGDEDEEEEDDDEDEDDDDEEEDEDDDEDEDEDDNEDEDEDEDQGENADGDDGEDETTTGSRTFRYPASVPNFLDLPARERAFKIARFVACTEAGCECAGLEPPRDAEITLVERKDVAASADGEGDDDSTPEGWWVRCGSCGHGWEGSSGHVFPANLSKDERVRRSRAVGRIEEILQVSYMAIVS